MPIHWAHPKFFEEQRKNRFLSPCLRGLPKYQHAAIVKIQGTGADAANLPSVKASVGLEVRRVITSVHDVAADRCGWRRHFVTLLMAAVYYPAT